MDYEDLDGLMQVSGDKKVMKTVAPGELSLKERFRRTMFFQEVGAPRPNLEFGYWARTLEVWQEQGLPKDINDEKSAYDYFGIEDYRHVAVNVGPQAPFEPELVEETDDYITSRDAMGVVYQVNKKGDQSIPHYLDFPIKDRETWQPFKAGLDPSSSFRLANLDESLEHIDLENEIVGVMGGSLVGIPRNFIGFQGIAMMSRLDPELLTEIVDTFGACICGVLEEALPKVQVDFCMGWEDICFNQGPIVPPEFFAEVAGPWYRRIADILTAHGCCVYTTDTDGNIMPIVDTFLDNGLTTMFPIEVAGGTDPCVLREKYGKRIKLWGGVCKMRLAESKESIDKELERLRPYVEQGGFIPTVDHRVPANIPFENYIYYLDKKRELFNVGGTPKY